MCEKGKGLSSSDFSSAEISAVESLLKLRRERKARKSMQHERDQQTFGRSNALVDERNYRRSYNITYPRENALASRQNALNNIDRETQKRFYEKPQPFINYCICRAKIPPYAYECVQCYRERQSGKVLYTDGFYRSINYDQVNNPTDVSKFASLKRKSVAKIKKSDKKPLKMAIENKKPAAGSNESYLEYDTNTNGSESKITNESDTSKESQSKKQRFNKVDVFKEEILAVVEKINLTDKDGISEAENIYINDFLKNVGFYNEKKSPDTSNSSETDGKRVKHVQSEHKRRCAINVGFKTLSMIVPNLETKSKKMILYYAIKHIMELRLEIAELKVGANNAANENNNKT